MVGLSNLILGSLGACKRDTDDTQAGHARPVGSRPFDTSLGESSWFGVLGVRGLQNPYAWVQIPPSPPEQGAS